MPWHFDDDDDDCSLACMHAILLSLIDYQLCFLLLLRRVELPLLDIVFSPSAFEIIFHYRRAKNVTCLLMTVYSLLKLEKRAHIYGYTSFFPLFFFFFFTL